ncbi:hypothetical protein [Bordetella pertussis]|nr:hypothetical protein [Bordetella pertussis]ETH74600.1 hypothetical protein L555_1919 [Bordetella pertussis STO1-CHOC-0008]
MYAWFIRTGFEKHLQTQPGRIQPIDSSHLAVANAVGRLTAPRSALEELL